jgi:hypothetical protein
MEAAKIFEDHCKGLLMVASRSDLNNRFIDKILLEITASIM